MLSQSTIPNTIPKLSTTENTPPTLPISSNTSNSTQPDRLTDPNNASNSQLWKKQSSPPPRPFGNSGANEIANSLIGKVELAKHISSLQYTLADVAEIQKHFAHTQVGIQNQIIKTRNLIMTQDKKSFEIQDILQNDIKKQLTQITILSNAVAPKNPLSDESASASNSESMLQVKQPQGADNKMAPSQKEEEELLKRIEDIKNHQLALRTNQLINTINSTTSINDNLSPENELPRHKIIISAKFIEMLISKLVKPENLEQALLQINTIDSQITDRDFIKAILKAHAVNSNLDKEPSLQQKDRSMAKIQKLITQRIMADLTTKSDNTKTLQECQTLLNEKNNQFFEELKDILNIHPTTEDPNNTRCQEIEKMDLTELRNQFLHLAQAAVLNENESFRKSQNELLEWIKKPFSPYDDFAFNSNKKALKSEIKLYRNAHNASIDNDDVLASYTLGVCKNRMQELYARFIYDPSYHTKFNKELNILIDEFFEKGYQRKTAHMITNCGSGGELRTKDKLKNLLKQLYQKNKEYHNQLHYAKTIIELENIFKKIQTEQNVKFVIKNSNKLPQSILEYNSEERQRLNRIKSQEEATLRNAQEFTANFEEMLNRIKSQEAEEKLNRIKSQEEGSPLNEVGKQEGIIFRRGEHGSQDWESRASSPALEKPV